MTEQRDIVEVLEHDHREVEEALKALEDMDTQDPEFMNTFRKMSNSVRQHKLSGRGQ